MIPRNSHSPAALAIAFAATGLFSVVLAEERIDTGALANRGVAWLSFADNSPAIHMVGTAGDIDGDGFDEIALGFLETPYEETEIPWALFVIYGRPRITGEVPLVPELERSWQVRSTDVNTELWASNVTGVAPAGDLDADGYGDFFISYGRYPHNDAGGGMALLVHGGPDLVGQAVLEDLVATERVTVFRTSDRRYAWVGHQCRLAGDFNGDGEEDIVLSAHGSRLDSATDENQGAVFVVFGARDLPREVDVARIGTDIPGLRIEGFEEEEVLRRTGIWGFGLGGGIAPLGDFDGDGLADLAMSAVSGRPQRFYVVLGGPTPPPVLRVADAASHPNVIELRSSSTNDGFLTSRIAGLGDVNGDGLPDFAFSKTPLSPSIFDPQESWVQVVFGSRTFAREIAIEDLPDHGVRLRAVQENAQFGRQLESAGDFDGDGRPDLAIGSREADPEGREDAGEAYILLSRDGFAEPSTLRGSFPGVRLVGAEPGDWLGSRDLGPAGDFDGDGFDDVLIVGRRASREQDEPPRVPRAYLIYGGPHADSPPAPLDLVSVDPAYGTKDGGTELTLRGAGFRGAPSVAFGAFLAPSVTVLSDSELRVVTPPANTAGPVDVTVTIDGETATLAGGFEYTDLPELNLDDPEEHGFLLRESEQDSSLGPSVAFGDLTGDGIDELISAGARSDRFAVSIVRGGPDLPPAQTAFKTSPRLSVITSFDPFLLYAGQVAVPGDVNGDGLDDLLVGAGEGRAFLVFGREDWPEELLLEDELFFFRAARLVVDDRVVSPLHFSGTGDLTGDGLDDFAVGFVRSVAVPGEPEPQREAELVFVDGRANWPEDFELDVPAFVRGRLRRAPSSSGFRWLVVPAGDVNGDGLRDLVVSIPSIAEAPGPVYLVYGSADLPGEADLDSFVEAGGGARIELEDTTGGALYGRAAGDVNGDGLSDLLISYENAAADSESVTLLVGGSAELEASIRLLRTAGDREGVLRISGDGARSVHWNAVTAGDFNADGYDDFLVGVSTVGEPPLAEISPRAFLVLGSAGLPEGRPDIALRSLGGQGLGIEAQAPGILRLPAETSGDLNGDGHPDFALLQQSLITAGNEPRQEDTVYVIYGLPGEPTAADGSFIRGDSNSDGEVNLTDGVFTLTHLFAGGEAPACEDAADTDDDGAVLLTDAIYLFEHLFSGGPEPPPPFAEAGEDPTDDNLGCGTP